tara:strand:- start:49 stop:1569 length:1521 start_codon:yes stop_codon:yes gene_type:complete
MALTPEEKEKLRDALKSETADEGGAIKNPFGGLISGFGNLGSSLKKLNDTLAKAPAKLKDASTIKFKGPKVPNIPKAIAKGLGTILGEGFANAIASFGNVKVFKGILNLGLLGGSLIPFALALKKFGGVRFDKVLIGVGALTAIAGIARILGDPAISTFVFLGAAAIGALGLALMPFGLGLDMVASAMEKLEPQLANLANALDVALTPFVTGIVELFETLRTGIETIGFVLVGEDGQSGIVGTIGGTVQTIVGAVGETLQSFGDNIEGIVGTIGETVTSLATTLKETVLGVIDGVTGALETGFDKTMELLTTIDGLSITGGQLAEIGTGLIALAAGLAAIVGANAVSSVGGVFSAAGDWLSGRDTNVITLIEKITSLGSRFESLRGVPSVLDRMKRSLKGLLDMDYDTANFSQAISEVITAVSELGNQVFGTDGSPFTSPTVGATAVGLATGVGAGGAGNVTVNNISNATTSPTQIVPDSNIGARSFDRDVLSPLDSASPFMLGGR